MKSKMNLKDRTAEDLLRELNESRLEMSKLKTSVRLGLDKHSSKVKQLKVKIAQIMTQLTTLN